MAVKVVIESAVLRGSQHDQFWQKVATVYPDGGEEFNVVAPPKAIGDSLEWLKQFQVRSPTAQGYNPVTDGRSHSIIQHVEAELQKRKRDSEIWRSGTNPDGRYVAAQICLRGHVLNVNGTDFERGGTLSTVRRSQCRHLPALQGCHSWRRNLCVHGGLQASLFLPQVRSSVSVDGGSAVNRQRTARP